MASIRHSLFGACTLAIGGCLVLAACTSSTETKNPVPVAIEPLIPATVRVTPTGATMIVGNELQLVASVLSEHQQEIRNAVVSWASAAPAVATVAQTGLVRAVGPGTAAITATAGSVSTQVVITVLPPDPGVVNVAATPGPMFVGETRQASAVVLNSRHQPLDNPIVHWTSGAASIATVSDAGLIRAVGEGTTQVTATSGSVSSSITVTVVMPAALRIEGSRLFVPGSNARLTVLAYDEQTRSSSPIPATWTTSDSLVAAVSADGVVTGGRPGTATVSAVTSRGPVVADVTTRTLPGRIAFARDNRQVALMNLDGGSPVEPSRFVLAGPASVALSPSGSLIAYDCPTGVCVAPVDGGHIRQLEFDYEASSSELSWPSWWNGDEGLAVKVRSVELGWAPLSTQLATTTSAIGSSMSRPRIAPIGTPFIYECDANLCLTGFYGSGLFATRASRAAWAPDGHHVSYDTPNGLCVAEELKPACSVILAHDQSLIIESAWSPDGTYLVLSRGAELWLIQANGENAVRLPLATRMGTSISSPSWSLGSAVVATP